MTLSSDVEVTREDGCPPRGESSTRDSLWTGAHSRKGVRVGQGVPFPVLPVQSWVCVRPRKSWTTESTNSLECGR